MLATAFSPSNENGPVLSGWVHAATKHPIENQLRPATSVRIFRMCITNSFYSSRCPIFLGSLLPDEYFESTRHATPTRQSPILHQRDPFFQIMLYCVPGLASSRYPRLRRAIDRRFGSRQKTVRFSAVHAKLQFIASSLEKNNEKHQSRGRFCNPSTSLSGD